MSLPAAAYLRGGATIPRTYKLSTLRAGNRLAGVNFFANMPRDPFADDPNDPASFLEEEAQAEPLSNEERVGLIRDLALVEEFARHLGPRGIDGIFFLCEDCDEYHYYEWDIMASNMRATLNGELAPVHEPGAEPNPMRYVPWDYAFGFMDGLDAR